MASKEYRIAKVWVDFEGHDSQIVEMHNYKSWECNIQMICNIFGATEKPVNWYTLWCQECNKYLTEWSDELHDGLNVTLTMVPLEIVTETIQNLQDPQQMKAAIFAINNNLQNMAYTDAFVEQGGVDTLADAISTCEGSTLGFALKVFVNLTASAFDLDLSSTPQKFLSKAVESVNNGNSAQVTTTRYALAVVTQFILLGSKNQIEHINDDLNLKSLQQYISSEDIETKENAFSLMTTILQDQGLPEQRLKVFQTLTNGCKLLRLLQKMGASARGDCSSATLHNLKVYQNFCFRLAEDVRDKTMQQNNEEFKAEVIQCLDILDDYNSATSDLSLTSTWEEVFQQSSKTVIGADKSAFFNSKHGLLTLSCFHHLLEDIIGLNLSINDIETAKSNIPTLCESVLGIIYECFELNKPLLQRTTQFHPSLLSSKMPVQELCALGLSLAISELKKDHHPAIDACTQVIHAKFELLLEKERNVPSASLTELRVKLFKISHKELSTKWENETLSMEQMKSKTKLFRALRVRLSLSIQNTIFQNYLSELMSGQVFKVLETAPKGFTLTRKFIATKQSESCRVTLSPSHTTIVFHYTNTKSATKKAVKLEDIDQIIDDTTQKQALPDTRRPSPSEYSYTFTLMIKDKVGNKKSQISTITLQTTNCERRDCWIDCLRALKNMPMTQSTTSSLIETMLHVEEKTRLLLLHSTDIPEDSPKLQPQFLSEIA
eukprot:Nk52_evm67s1020 gene=Nk52_evmTU67s1020